jgi:hypothetical protein
VFIKKGACTNGLGTKIRNMPYNKCFEQKKLRGPEDIPN